MVDRQAILYTHPRLNAEVRCPAGFYVPQKEATLSYNGRQVLYLLGQAVVESSCCGTGSWRYVQVPGYVAAWKSSVDACGQPVSEIEPIADEASRNDIIRLIEGLEQVSQVEVW